MPHDRAALTDYPGVRYPSQAPHPGEPGRSSQAGHSSPLKGITMAQTAPVTKTESNGAPRPYEKLVSRLNGKAELDASVGSGQSAFEIASQVIDKIAQATTEDDIFDANDSSLGSIEDFVGQPINVTGLVFQKSDAKYKDGLGAYAVIDFFTDNAEVHKRSCGAPNVVASLEQAQSLGLVKEDKPWRIKVVAKPTTNGTLLKIGRP